MSRLFNRFWISLTIVLSLVFIALFLPMTADRFGMMKAIFYTLTGLAVIWLVYFIRAYIFSRNSS